MTKKKKSELVFFKIDVGSAESLTFFKDLFLYLDFKLTFELDHQIHFTNGQMGVVIHHCFHVSGSGIYVMDTGINTLFFKVDSREKVDKFYEKFLKVRQIPITTNEIGREEEGGYSIFFKTPERITVGIISD